jgi:hypothetical protein
MDGIKTHPSWLTMFEPIKELSIGFILPDRKQAASIETADKLYL